MRLFILIVIVLINVTKDFAQSNNEPILNRPLNNISLNLLGDSDLAP